MGLLGPPQGVENKRTYELSEEELTKLRMEVAKYQTEADLVRISA
jgi:ribosomal protein S13